MAYKHKTPNFQLLSTATLPGAKNGELDTFARDVHGRLNLLEAKTGLQAVGLSKQAPVTAKPAKAQLAVSATNSSGLFKVGITLPEFTSPAVTGNPSRVPLYHQVQYSPAQDFSAKVTQLPKGHQVYWPVFEAPGSRLFFRMRSSFDGINWNDWTQSPAVQG